VLIRGVNDDEVDRLISFADGRGLDIRFIEFMPNRYSAPGDPRFISGKEIRDRLPWALQSLPSRPSSAARYYAAPPLGIRIGFISSVSHPFCGACDRIRLTADGFLYICLYDSGSINLFDLLAEDPGQARVEFERLAGSKRFGNCHGAAGFAATLPSFSAMGG
jgi:cyclic pyranopterin phosphate synthase